MGKRTRLQRDWFCIGRTESSRSRTHGLAGGGLSRDMDYMARHGVTRARPAELLPGTAQSSACGWITCLTPPMPGPIWQTDPRLCLALCPGPRLPQAHAKPLQQLGERLAAEVGGCQFRAFSDSAPVLEVALARNAALGWKGKHTLLLDRAGSWFFWANCLSTWRLNPIRRPPTIAAPARPASISARRAPFWRPTNSMRGAAFPI
jgi:epoxyqueuosine reductase QueG